MIRVMVVDDSRLVRTVLREILEADPDVRVVEEAENGREAVDKCLTVEPDVILMDVQMPVMDGLEAVERIMRVRPTPVIILSATVSPGEVKSAFRAVRAGAFEALPKPQGVASREGYARVAEDLRSRVRLYARVGRQRGWQDTCLDAAAVPRVAWPRSSARVVAVGASTGGPRTVQALLRALPPDFPSPLLLVQHIGLGFARGFAEWLQREVALPVRVVDRPERLQPGRVYLAMDGHHLEVRRDTVVVRSSPPVNGCRPSVDVLFRSVARECGRRGVAVVLTGMGRDGARGALEVQRAGGDVIVQDERSSIIFGMPRAAIELGAATRVVGAPEIPQALAEVLTGSRGSPADS